MQKYSKAEAGRLGAEKSKITSALRQQERINLYNLNPKTCKRCNKTLGYFEKRKLFCSSSCSATFNNLKRTENIRKNPKQYKEKRAPVSWNCLNCEKEHTTVAWRVGKYCGSRCQKDHQYKERIKKWLEEGISWNLQIPGWAKKHLSDTRGYACEVCGISEWNGKTLSLECDHIDGHHANNHPSNLRLICPNCHSQTETYKAKNKGKGREKRRLSNQ